MFNFPSIDLSSLSAAELDAVIASTLVMYDIADQLLTDAVSQWGNPDPNDQDAQSEAIEHLSYARGQADMLRIQADIWNASIRKAKNLPLDGVPVIVT
jgi:hypothetical protein